MLIVEDLIHTLQWQAFWTHKDKAIYPVLEQMKELQSMLAANERCPEQFEVINGQIEQLHQDFLEFEKECETKSELCHFFGVWLQLVAIVKNAVVSDREGNWNLDVATVEHSMQIYAEYDCIYYQRYGSCQTVSESCRNVQRHRHRVIATFHSTLPGTGFEGDLAAVWHRLRSAACFHCIRQLLSLGHHWQRQ